MYITTKNKINHLNGLIALLDTSSPTYEREKEVIEKEIKYFQELDSERGIRADYIWFFGIRFEIQIKGMLYSFENESIRILYRIVDNGTYHRIVIDASENDNTLGIQSETQEKAFLDFFRIIRVFEVKEITDISDTFFSNLINPNNVK
jgi:hypothetical protein